MDRYNKSIMEKYNYKLILSKLFIKKKKDTEDSKSIIRYERINFFNEFRNNGHVKKILGIINGNYDEEYYNDRKMTEVPCVDGELLIISNYNHEEHIDTYILVQIDFSIAKKYKVLMRRTNEDKSNNPQYLIYKYLKDNNMIYIENNGVSKKPQISNGYGGIMKEILMELVKDETLYTEEQLFTLLVDNFNLSKNYKKSVDEFREMNKEKDLSIDPDRNTAYIRTKSRLENYVSIIYNNSNASSLTTLDVLIYLKQYQENFMYNV